MLRLDDRWVWDCWVADDGESYHLFSLQAPRALGDPALRHRHATVGHAVSTDLVHWTDLGECLGPGRPGAWDDRAIWTGSVVTAYDRWWMAYTAIATAGPDVATQRIGLAVSDDLHHWERVGDAPVVDPDPRWYRVDPCGGGLPVGSPTWRDPCLVADPGGEGWHLLITAAAAGADPADAGVIGHARSADLSSWEVLPPLSAPGAGFRHLEVPHLDRVDDRGLLTFTCHPRESVRGSATGCCTWSVPAPAGVGPFDVAAARPFPADPDLFAAPVVRRRDGSRVLLGFQHLESHGRDGFAIGDPVEVGVDADGYLEAGGVAGGPTDARSTRSQGSSVRAGSAAGGVVGSSRRSTAHRPMAS